MKNKKVILLILAILAVLILVSVLVVQKLKRDEVVVVNRDDNVNQNVNEIVEKEPEIIDGVDISDWKTYRNEELGISFKYPSYYGDFILTQKSSGVDRDVRNGEYASLYYPDSNLSMVFYSKNYDAFIKPSYVGDVDLSNVCKHPLDVSRNHESVDPGFIGFCDNVVVDKQKTFYDTKLSYLPESSGVYMSQNVYLNLDNSKYDALIISIHLEDFTNDLDKYYIVDNKELEAKAGNYLNNIISNSLDNNMQDEINNFKTVVYSIKLLN